MDDEEKKNKWHNHIDFDRSGSNKYLVQKDIKEMYQELFGEAVAEYNAKQKRNDRKIDDYYSKVLKNKRLEPQREFIVQIGEKDDYYTEQQREVVNMILEKYVNTFEERNPNLKIYNAVIHNDEATPHLHINIIPVATGYKRGVQAQPSFDKALKQQGIEYSSEDSRSLLRNYRDNEIKFIETEMLECGIERKLVGTNSIKDHHQYKELQSKLEEMEEELEKKIDDFTEIQGEIEELNAEKEELLEIAKNAHIEELKGYGNESTPKGYLLIKRTDFDRLKQQNENIPFIISENNHLKKKNKMLEEEKQEKDIQLNDMKEMLDRARRRLNAILDGGNDLWDRCLTYASKFHKKGKEIAPSDMLESQDGESDYKEYQHKNKLIQQKRIFQR